MYDREAISISREKYNDITKYIEDNYSYNRSFALSTISTSSWIGGIFNLPKRKKESFLNKKSIEECSLEELLKSTTETFKEMLFRLIDRSKMADIEVYKKANIDRRLFSKIKTNKDYTPKLKTVVSLAIALE